MMPSSPLVAGMSSSSSTNPLPSSSFAGGSQPHHHSDAALSLTGISSSSLSSSSAAGGLLGSLSSNPYFSAGAGLYVLGTLGMFGRLAARVGTHALKRRFVVSMECTNKEPAHDWIMQWLSSRHPSIFQCQQVSVLTTNVVVHANEETTGTTHFAPCPNVAHWLTHKGWPIMVYRKRQVDRAMGSDVLETLELMTIGRSSDMMREIVEEARSQAVLRDSDKTVIYHNTGGRWTRHELARPRRPMGSVILAGNMREFVVADVRRFLDSKEYYTKLGVPYRRGYLLHGPPGCGKSSFVMALAGEMRLAICVLSLSNRGLDDDALNNLLNTAPLRSIVLLEDIDRAFTNDSRVTMSGLLNAIDGVGAQEGRLVFMTTNHVERLDAALIRPGRADLKLEVGLCAEEQIRELFVKFFPAASPAEVTAFAKAVPADAISAAQLQSHLFLHRDDAQQAILGCERFVKDVQGFEVKLEARRAKQRLMASLPSPPML